MPVEQTLVASSITPDGTLKVWVEYDIVTLEVTRIIYDNDTPFDAAFHIQKEGSFPVDRILTKNTIQGEIAAPPGEYYLALDAEGNKVSSNIYAYVTLVTE